ncbi:hypothetical protein LCGC14_0330190 [marine sediment metagenome]|uniref:Uncharacterized protein n=1 Tax=marine sediment metagenome TaxID=412755 RepID=A0A0F9W446_9ZZZZ
MNSTVEELTIALWKVENQISKLVDKYLSTEMPAKSFMTRQTPLLMQRSVLVAKLKVLGARSVGTDSSSQQPSAEYPSTTTVDVDTTERHDTKPDNSTERCLDCGAILFFCNCRKRL